MLSTDAAGGLSITPIFWAPRRGRYALPTRYEPIIDRYIANIAAASGSTGNVFSVATEYYEEVAGVRQYIRYRIQARPAIVARGPLPWSGCRPEPQFRACITDQQLRTELQRVVARYGPASNLANFYAVFLPPGVETVDRNRTNSVNGYCGYHRAFGVGSRQTVYAEIPYEAGSDCNSGQAPNRSISADGAIDHLSHELSEAITDPLQDAWSDVDGNEEGDMCVQDYGRPLGSTDPADPKHTEYNQVINGGRYYTQAEFSSRAYARSGHRRGCVLGEVRIQPPSAAQVAPPQARPGSAAVVTVPTTARTIYVRPRYGNQRLWAAPLPPRRSS